MSQLKSHLDSHKFTQDDIVALLQFAVAVVVVVSSSISTTLSAEEAVIYFTVESFE
jgi:hypothetical protein